MPASFGNAPAGGADGGGAATPGPGSTRPAPAVASTVAKRPADWVRAPVPPAPGRDMTASELTHAMQQVMAQSQNDQVWLGQLHEEMGVQVEHINAHAVKMVGALHNVDLTREDARKAFDKIEQNDLSIKSIVDGHVQALYKSNETTLQRTDLGLREHVQSEIRCLHEIVSALGDSGPKGAPTGDTAADSVLEARLMAKTQQIEQDMRTLHGELTAASRFAQETAQENQQAIGTLREHVQRMDSGVQAAMGDMAQRVQVVQGCAAATAAAHVHQQQPPHQAPTAGPAAQGTGPQAGPYGAPVFPPQPGQPTAWQQRELSQRPPKHQSHTRQRPPFWQEEATAALRHHREAEEHHLNTTVCHPGMTTTAAADV